MPTDERYSRYHQTADGTYVHKMASHLSPCLRLWSGCVITTTGDVLPCCYDKDHRHALGNIAEQSLAEIFHSKRANALRHRVISATDSIPEMCKNCNR